MSYEFTKLSEVPAVSKFPEGANAIIETNGEIKRCPTSNTPKPLTYDYMPEGYPRKSVQTTTLIDYPEVPFEPTSSGTEYRVTLPDPFEIVVGKTYTVNWDGIGYECIGVALPRNVYIIGNLSIMGGDDDTGEPFLYTYESAMHRGQFTTLDTSARHTISVKTAEETVTPMAEELLPSAALITYDSSTSTYSSDLTYDELHERLLGGKQVVLHKTVENEYLYLSKWAKSPSGKIDLAFSEQDYSATLNTDGTIVKKLLS